MAKIREDLDGVVYVRVGPEIVCLAAGDEIPGEAEVGEHLTADTPAPKKRGRPAKASDDAGDDD